MPAKTFYLRIFARLDFLPQIFARLSKRLGTAGLDHKGRHFSRQCFDLNGLDHNRTLKHLFKLIILAKRICTLQLTRDFWLWLDYIFNILKTFSSFLSSFIRVLKLDLLLIFFSQTSSFDFVRSQLMFKEERFETLKIWRQKKKKKKPQVSYIEGNKFEKAVS